MRFTIPIENKQQIIKLVMKIRYTSDDCWAFAVIESYNVAKAFFTDGTELYECFEKDGASGESLISSLKELKQAYKRGAIVGVEIGNIYEKKNMI